MKKQFMTERSSPRANGGLRRRAVLRLSAVLVGTLLAFAVLEGVYQMVRFHRDGTFQNQYVYDAELGWRVAERYRAKSREMKDMLGVTYLRSIETNEVGARLWGTNPGHPKVLFIGDSFTEAQEVSNDKTYPYVFAQKTGFDVYAYGVGGYGTLQEFLALKRLFPQVRPDIVVLQFFSNDWMNNNAAWESTSIEFQARILRPYYNLRTNRVEFEFPRYHPFTILFRSLALVGWISGKTTEILYQFYPHGSFEPNGEFHQARFRESIDVTKHLLGQFSRYVGRQSKLFAFNCAENDQHEYFKKIATENGFYVLEGASRYIESNNNATVTTRTRSDHFNEYGNHLLGEWLAENLVKEWKRESY